MLADPLAERGRELVVVALAVDRLEQPVEERGQLNGLPVGAPDERRRPAVAGSADLAEELDARRRGRARRGAASRPPAAEGGEAPPATSGVSIALLDALTSSRLLVDRRVLVA